MGMHNGTFLLPFKKSLSVYKNTGIFGSTISRYVWYYLTDKSTRTSLIFGKVFSVQRCG